MKSNPRKCVNLKINKRNAIREIPVQMFENVIISWTDRMRYCKQSCGAYLNDIIPAIIEISWSFRFWPPNDIYV